MLEVRDIRKAFGNQEVLSGISFSIEKGDVAVILGPSGSGKTTLLRCLEFFEQADSGEVLFDDIDVDLRNVTKEQIKAIRQKTAFVFQNYNLFNNKTALENILEGLVIGPKFPKRKQKLLRRKHWIKSG
ncbi:putative amino-acid import ATP-binding protein YxeO [bioreactor metagenome]|uniref:Putative amino-acid import ATP-binding protein YxeO n=1 Tax=bioreactor metagenome TaxID=1076179 RepID=A0A644WKH2_9ZZZZ